ncbi:M23 family metallopeptidase [Nocardioides sambongensis]|uniref:M23 family metallopeptidase n=1 Tax=Nocardioides sambongensis TaxID=2589074 RepID=UPI0018C88C92|nr:M23 family metallopeptidase [Nocardioides sambongensis]
MARTAKREKYVGRRVAGRIDDTTETLLAADLAAEEVTPALSAEIAPELVTEPAIATLDDAAPAEPTLAHQPLFAAPTVELPTLAELAGHPALVEQPKPEGSGRRRAAKAAGSRGRGLRGLPSIPVAAGLATLAVAVSGAVVSADPVLVNDTTQISAANASSGSFGVGTYDALRVGNVSRDSDRSTLGQATDGELVDEAEKIAVKRDEALGELAKDAEKEAAEIALNRWILPMDAGVYRITSTFGDSGAYWSSVHTGLDFAAPSGTQLYAMANGTITFTGDDGAYGNKTVITLEDGTELWYCHQTSISVSVGDTVNAGDAVGTVGSTGNTTGPHLHLEVRPGGGDPVDPYAALVAQGITP